MAITVGQPAPDFTLHETPERQHRLSDYRGSHVVLVFFPGAFTRVVSVNWWKSRKRVIIGRGDRAYAACFIPSMS